MSINNRLIEFLHDLRCVSCNTAGSLAEKRNVLECSHCMSSFELDDGCPIFLDGEVKKAFESDLSSDVASTMVDEYSLESDKNVSWKGRIYSILRPPEIMHHFNHDLSRRADTCQLFNHKGSNTRILNVGGGPFRYSDRELTMNIRPFYNVDCVGDGHDIPFANNTFDSVICVAVLEHVHNPEKVVSEMIRVLKPGGILYAEVPYIFFFHGYPNDYKRYTREGMKRLFGETEGLDIGMTQGPVSAVLQSANTLIDIMVPDHWHLTKKLLNGTYRWLFFPFKYIDILLRNNPKAHRLAGGFYALGRKKSTP